MTKFLIIFISFFPLIIPPAEELERPRPKEPKIEARIEDFSPPDNIAGTY